MKDDDWERDVGLAAMILAYQSATKHKLPNPSAYAAFASGYFRTEAETLIKGMDIYADGIPKREAPPRTS